MKRYFINLFIGTDQLVNAICGGDPDETISSRIGKRRDGAERFWAKVVNILFFWEKDHCTASIEYDEGNPKKKSGA